MSIPARPTIYRGIPMRSRLEARVAAWFDRHQIPWVYEPTAFADQDGQYLPDFEIKDFGVAGRGKRPVYVEVKPTWELADQWKPRMRIIWSSDPSADLLILAPGYLDFAFGLSVRDLPDGGTGISDLTAFGNQVHTWLGGWGDWRPDPAKLPAEAGEFHQCVMCGQATLTITTDSFACARCGHGDGDHHLGQLLGEDGQLEYLPVPYESGEGHA